MKFLTYIQFKKILSNLLKTELNLDVNELDESSIITSYNDGWTPHEHMEMILAKNNN
ncbi:hypothetical protein [uncultured Pseudoalteromonas sp.]|uniref:hypothetical protein n=1 Tax=uncultured Pseudoalteromonas sp. TaxID=114053 RepID=UPI002595C8E3|nr:hypothetical protein [uncultured Pseudoalteromonas sp.]